MTWNPAFFTRLTDFVATAGKYGVVVELSLFGGYESAHEFIWAVCPFNPNNHIQNMSGELNRTNVYTLSAPHGITAIQIATATELAKHTKDFDNVYFQIISRGDDADLEWGRKVADAIHSVDPDRLIAQPSVWPPLPQCQITNFDSSASPIDVYNATFNSPTRPGPLAYDESGDVYHSVEAYRQSYWRWVLSGGGVVDNLDWSFFVKGYENGTLPTEDLKEALNSGEHARTTLSILNQFIIQHVDFVHMRPDFEAKYVSVVSGNDTATQGLVYLTAGGAQVVRYAGLIAVPQQDKLSLQLRDPCGLASCNVDYVDTSSGALISGAKAVEQCTGDVDVPEYDGDIAFFVTC